MTTAIALPTGRKGQAYAIAGSGALLLLLWFGLMSPLLGWYADRAAETDHQRDVLSHLSAVSARLPALERELAERTRSSPGDIESTTDARAGADLQQRLEAMAQKAGAHIVSVEFLQPQVADGYRRIPLQLSVSARWPVLISLLAAIDQASPQLFLDDLHLRATGAEGDPTPAATATFQVITLRATPARTAAPL